MASAASSGSTVSDQMSVLMAKADQLALKDAILGDAVISHVKELLQTAKKAAVLLTAAEGKEINVSRKLEEWLEKVNAAILKADDALDECEYLVQSGEADSLEPKADPGEPKANSEEPKKNPPPNKNYLSMSSITAALRTGWSTSPSTSKRLKWANSALRKAIDIGVKVAKEVEAEADTDDDADGDFCRRTAAAQATNDCSEIEAALVQETQDVKSIADNMLISSSETDLSVFTLVGYAETGKTALARLLYKNTEVMFYFDERMWVQAPGDLNVEAIATRMLANLNRATDIDSVAAADQPAAKASDQPAASVLEAKTARLQTKLKGKRFLLVLADAADLNQAKFELLKDFLVKLGGSRGSKVLITTGKAPAKLKVSFVYNMKLEMDDYCWRLLHRIAFAEGGASRTPRMEELSKTMAKLCKGKLLHVKLLGSLLYRLKHESRWLSIRDKLVDSYPIPKLCFDHMTSLPLKQCFRYCSIFPKGYLMLREELIELWMAQGYLNVRKKSGSTAETNPNVRKRSSPTMEALGQQYYDVLMRSSFLHVSEEDDFDTQSCKMPDVLHGLDLFMESSKHSFKTVVKVDPKGLSGDFEHLTLIKCEEKLSKSFKDRFSRLRSLRLENTKGLAHFLACAQGLRSLIIVDASLKVLPDSISKLICLRYLDISGTSIVRLPDSISKLYNLQTLRLHDLKESPKNFENLLVRMTHLHIQKLENLYEMYELLSKCGELVYLSSAKASLKVFMDKEGRIDHTKLHQLSNRCSTISIHCLENASKAARGISAWLSEVPGTEILKLNWSTRREIKIDEDVLDNLIPNQSLKELTLENFRGTQFPNWMDSALVSNLVKLELENCSWCETLPPLGHLSCLRILSIMGMENVQSITKDFYGGCTSGPAFAKLKDFTLWGMSNLQDWSEPASSITAAFPYLERFEVDLCHSLTRIPDIVLSGEPKSLRRFKVSHCVQLTGLPKKLGELGGLEDLELFGLPSLGKFSIGNSTNLKSLIIGCVSTEETEEETLKQLKSLPRLTNLTIWGYNREDITDCLGELASLQVLKFESCRSLKILPKISSLKELHITYCSLLEDSCIKQKKPQWPKVSHIKTILVNNEKIREPTVEISAR